MKDRTSTPTTNMHPAPARPAMSEHERVKDPLSTRPPRKHLQGCARILRRNAAKYTVIVRDPHAGTEHYTGAVWTGSERVLKAVAA